MASREEYWALALKILFIEDCGTESQYKEVFPLLVKYLYNTLGIHSLYRYRPDDKWEKRDKEDFVNDMIWFQPMSGQNDPFEFSFNMDCFNLPDISSFEAYLAAFLNLDFLVKGYVDLLWHQFEDYKDKCSIACLCEQPDNILLWSYYANSHQGYCVEYSSIDILNSFQCFVLPVLYHDKFPTFSDMFFGDMKEKLLPYHMALKAITSKASFWALEQEWRVVRTLGSGGEKVPFPAPKAVYLGCNANSTLETDLKNVCKNKRIPVFKMKKNRTDYKLHPLLIQE